MPWEGPRASVWLLLKSIQHTPETFKALSVLGRGGGLAVCALQSQ